MSNTDVLSILNKLAKNNRKRVDFNRAVRKAFPKCLGHGAFRSVYAAGDMVVKLRRSRTNDSGFSMSDIHPANKEEADNYEDMVRNNPMFARFVLRPTYYTLSNGHDAVLMRRVEKVWGSLPRYIRDRHEEEDTLLGRQYRIISNCFRDAHLGNIGVIGKRLYLIDLNMGFNVDMMMDFMSMAEIVLSELAGVQPDEMALQEGA